MQCSCSSWGHAIIRLQMLESECVCQKVKRLVLDIAAHWGPVAFRQCSAAARHRTPTPNTRYITVAQTFPLNLMFVSKSYALNVKLPDIWLALSLWSWRSSWTIRRRWRPLCVSSFRRVRNPRPDRVSIASTERKKAQTAVVSSDSLFVILACCHGDAAASQTNSYTLSYVHMSAMLMLSWLAVESGEEIIRSLVCCFLPVQGIELTTFGFMTRNKTPDTELTRMTLVALIYQTFRKPDRRRKTTIWPFNVLTGFQIRSVPVSSLGGHLGVSLVFAADDVVAGSLW